MGLNHNKVSMYTCIFVLHYLHWLINQIVELIKEYNIYSIRPTLFVLFEKSNFLREHHLLSCLPFKNV